MNTTTLFHSLSQLSGNRNVLPLWEKDYPVNQQLAAQCIERSIIPNVFDRALTGISTPELLIYEPAVSRSNQTGILIIPGGGYRRIAIDKEGLEIARILIEYGYTAFVLSYRMPEDQHPQGVDVSLNDAQQAMHLMQTHKAWQHIHNWGVLGFSAGGHIAARLATQQCQTPTIKNGLPDFAALIYPVISMNPQIAHPGSRHALMGDQISATVQDKFSVENHVSPRTPPCFIVHAADDSSVPAENSQVFYHALKQHQISAEMHLFESGEHGFAGRAAPETPANLWPELLNRWIKQRTK